MSAAMQLKAKIRNLAASYGVPAQAVLQNYMLERLLERISLSPHRDHMILKGGMLIASLVGIASRTTMDMDTTLRSYPLSETAIQAAFEEICAQPLPDSVSFRVDRVEPIRDDDEYGGFRVALTATFESIQTPLKVDVTTGDAITPAAVCYAFPSAFEEKRIEVWAYPIETILAEKIETILRRGALNTRPRDFYDVYILSRTHAQTIDRAIFRAALDATARKRLSSGALDHPAAILLAVQTDPAMRARWERYAREYTYASGITFDEACASVAFHL